MNEDEERLDQPEVFELELELLRWVKKAVMETIPPIMQKPSGNVAQHYGLDSKSRWREAVCVMMILSEPAITAEGVTKLGRQMAQLFRQDYQLWDVKAKQLKSWVDRGLLNVKLLDRTLAYFQNQSSWLQYIKTLKKPVPKIESPGFPGTQWNEFYWKDQTVMLLMQETDFPDGKNPEFCAKLFKEEPGKWRLKMEQFKRWLEKGKNDPLPEYYGTGKNCAECGVFLWDTRSYLKHMKRNHGYKIKEKDKLMIKNDKREKPEKCEEDFLNTDKFQEIMESAQQKADINVSNPSPDLKLQPQDSRSKDSFDSIFKGDTSKSNSLDNLLVSESEKNESDLDEKASKKDKVAEPSYIENKAEIDTSAPLRRRAAQKTAIKDAIVSCPECDFQCLHSKIVSHLKRCTKKAAQAKKKANIQNSKSNLSPKYDKKQEKNSISKVNAQEEKEKKQSSILEPEVKKHKESDIVKKVFMKKFEAQKNLEREKYKFDDLSDDDSFHKEKLDKSPRFTEKQDKDLFLVEKHDISPIMPEKQDKIPYWTEKKVELDKSPHLIEKNDKSPRLQEKQDKSPRLTENKDESPCLTEKQPPLKLKLSRKEFSKEISHFEVSVEKDEIEAVFGKSLAIPKNLSDKSNQPTILLKNINTVSKKDYQDVHKVTQPSTRRIYDPDNTLTVNQSDSKNSTFSPVKSSELLDEWDNHSDTSSSKIKEDSSEDEILPQKSKRIKDIHKIPQLSKQESKKMHDMAKSNNIKKTELKNTSVSEARPTKVLDEWEDRSDESVPKQKDDTSEDEILPQKSKRLKDVHRSIQQEKKRIYVPEKQTSIDESSTKTLAVSQVKSTKVFDDWENSSDTSLSKLKDESSEDEVLPQKSKRLKGFLESFKPVEQTESEKFKEKRKILQDIIKPTDDFSEEAIPVIKARKKEDSNPKEDMKLSSTENVQSTKKVSKPDEKSNMKNKWLESLEKRNKGKLQPFEAAPLRPTKHSQDLEISNKPDNNTPLYQNENSYINEEVANKEKDAKSRTNISKEIKIPEVEAIETKPSHKAKEDEDNDKYLSRKCTENKKERSLARKDTPEIDPIYKTVQDLRANKKAKISSSDEYKKTVMNPINVELPTTTEESRRVQNESFEDHEGRASLRRSKMIPCPLCGVEYAIASNLQKHIDKEHSEGDDRSHNKRKSKDKADPARKKKKVDDASDAYEDPRPGPSGVKKQKPARRSDDVESILEKSRTSNMEVDLDNPDNPVEKEKESEQDKLTEYEIFQKLQLKEPSKTDRKKVECKECGLYLPTNTIKRHLLKHEKNALKAQLLAENPKPDKDSKVPCTQCNKMFPPNTLKKHMVKHRRENEKEENVKDNEDTEPNNLESEEFSDERIPCQQCGKMLPKNAMKRHLMKHEIVAQESDSEKVSDDKNTNDDFEEEKPKSARKKVTCVECGLQLAPNVIKRHLEKHAKMKAASQNEIYAPIEITPTKEYWEYMKEKTETKSVKSDLNKNKNKKTQENSSESEQSQGEEEEEAPETNQPKKSKEDKKERSKLRKDSKEMEPIHKTVKDMKEAEKAKNSEEESESENPLETAVRKVVSYRMTPKQALSIYNLTPKVLFDNLLGETDNDRMSILKKVNLSSSGEKKVINYCKQNEAQLSYKAVINCVRDLKIKDDCPDFSLSRLEAYRWWYAFRKKFDLKITAKKK